MGVLKRLQERGIIRKRVRDIRFLHVTTTYHAQRHRRGTFVFETILKYTDEDGEIRGYETIVNFQPDDRRYYLHHLFLTEEADRAQAIKEALRAAKETQGYNRLSDESLLDAEGMHDIRSTFVQALNDIELWVENRNGYPFKKLKHFGRFWLNLQRSV
ncbi:hypothetical protein [Phaeodactylibacter xiamenensis]|jgi:hypothetical protein|uniref:hypothetical protein n=1 Tax=Phaeodactylibacter xiamenensis TaxID=1524460 RepID=UPI0024A80677|nr:hypothetical protein [Phaeodactylibacter xiamenensis]